jgi:methionyl aminopeptidase
VPRRRRKTASNTRTPGNRAVRRVPEVRLKTPDDIRRIAEAGRIIAEIYGLLPGMGLDGLATLEIDRFVEEEIGKRKARPSFTTVRNYAHATCISVNNEIVHGVPSKKKRLKKGDIVKIDIGVVKGGYFADRCDTFLIEPVTDEARRLVMVTQEALQKGIEMARPGKHLGDIGNAIQKHAEGCGYSVVREFTGHGVGFAVHEQPYIPHYGRKGSGREIEAGMVLAIEPMVNQGTRDVASAGDGWTMLTADGKLSAQFEHTIAVTVDGPVILTR